MGNLTRNQRSNFEHSIREIISNDNGNDPVFEFSPNWDSGWKLDLYIYNPIQMVSHFYGSVISHSPLDCLVLMYKRVKRSPEAESEMNNYTIRWSKGTITESHDSYFREVSEEKAVEKFFQGKEETEYIIHDVILSPIS